MLTASYLMDKSEVRPEFCDQPVDNGLTFVGLDSIDAPLCLAAGSIVSVEYHCAPGEYYPATSIVVRGKGAAV
jgi:hypothetical protein